MTIKTTSKISLEALEDTAKQKRDELAAARAVADQRKTAADAAAARFEEIDAAFDTGDDESFTVEDFTMAEGEAATTAKLYAAAVRTVERLERQQTNLDIRAAESLVPIIERAMKGRVPIVARIGGKPGSTTAAGTEIVPSIVLSQRGATKSKGGILSASQVQVTYLRDGLMSPLPIRAIEDAANAAGFGIQTTRHVIGNGSGEVVHDDYAIKVHQSWLDPMTLTSPPSQSHVDTWAAGMARTFAANIKHDQRSMRMMGDPLRISTSSHVKATMTTTRKAGVAKTAVDLSFRVTPGFQALPGFAERWRGLPSEFVGKAAQGLGILTAAELTSLENTSRDAGWAEGDVFALSLHATFEAIISA